MRSSIALVLSILAACLAGEAARPPMAAEAIDTRVPCMAHVAWDIAPANAANPSAPVAEAPRVDDTPPSGRVLPRAHRVFRISYVAAPHLVAPPVSPSALPDLSGTRTGVPLFSHTAPPPIG